MDIKVTREEYRAMIAAQIKIEIIRDMISSDGYTTIDDIAQVLGVKEVESDA